MDRREKMRQQLLATFRVELDEHLGTLNRDIMTMEQGVSAEENESLLAGLFRAAHSVKGAARAVNLRDIEIIAHRLEDILGALRRQELTANPGLFDALFPAVDAMGEAMEAHLRQETLPKEQQDQIVAGLEAALRGEAVASSSKRPNQSEKKTEAQKPSKKGAEQVKTIASDPKQDTPAVPVTPQRPFLPDNSEPVLPSRMKPSVTSQPISGTPGAVTSKETEASPKPARPAKRSGSLKDETIRVKTRKLDTLMARMGELMIARMRKEQRLHELRVLQQQVASWQKAWRQAQPHYKRVLKEADFSEDMHQLMEFMAANHDHLGDIGSKINSLVAGFAGDYDRLAHLTDDLQDGVRRVRMLPSSTLFDIFPRMIRDLAKELGKEVMLQVVGGETEVDRQVLDAMKDPLMHILRNSVDHGIGFPQERETKNKPRRGTIKLSAAQRGNTIVIEVADDGNGINLGKLRRVAIERGVLAESEADSLGRHETLDLIFCSGLSTKSKVTDLSGRGVGLDVVRENLKSLQGLIQVDTVEGEGTTFTLTLPLTLATSQVLLLDVRGEMLALPTIAVERILQVKPEALGSIEGKPALRVDERPMPLISLGRVLEFSGPDEELNQDDKIPVVVVGMAERRIAFRVDGFFGTQEVVVNTLGRQLSRVRYVSGATILGNGSVVMVLNVGDLMKSSQVGVGISERVIVKSTEVMKNRVLVVDDSITTRTLEKNILENAGYRVLTAADGEEAWALIQDEKLDVVVSDVDMPRMNGLALAEKVKGDDRFGSLPFILVTSLESPTDKLRGMEAGAEAYIVKGSFDQKILLETIERLVG